ncbi:hypothetical protein EDD86DRAFT_199972 [Gorgonomyces haynaldii]|nr:hypothetical protein EDD86DRAFT_199972 [Gorgonomyces haynaldii]
MRWQALLQTIERRDYQQLIKLLTKHRLDFLFKQDYSHETKLLLTKQVIINGEPREADDQFIKQVEQYSNTLKCSPSLIAQLLLEHPDDNVQELVYADQELLLTCFENLLELDDPQVQQFLISISPEFVDNLLQSHPYQRFQKLFGILLIKLADRGLCDMTKIVQKLIHKQDKYLFIAFVVGLSKASVEAIQPLMNQEWTSEWKGICLVSWIRFLELQNAYGREIEALKRIFVQKYIRDQTTYQILDQMVVEPKDDLDHDLQKIILSSLQLWTQHLVLSFKRHLKDVMLQDQDLKANQEEEDTKRRGLDYNTVQQETAYERLLLLMIKIQDQDPIVWWSGDLFSFLKQCSQAWLPTFLVLFVKLLTALSNGPQSSQRLHEVLSNDQQQLLGPVLWSTFFRTLNSYIDRQNQTESDLDLSQQELELVHSFLRLVSKTVRNAFSCRRTLTENQNYRALVILFNLLVGRLRVETKAEILACIASFCDPIPEASTIVEQVWGFLEQSGMIQGGLEKDLMEIEMQQHSYPQTIQMMHLLDQLFANTKFDPVFSFVSQLGHPNRNTGSGPYMRYCMQCFCLNIAQEDFYTSVLQVFKTSLEQSLEFTQPGFHLLVSLYSGSPVVEKMCKLLETGSDTVKVLIMDVFVLALNLQEDFIQMSEPVLSQNVQQLGLIKLVNLEHHLVYNRIIVPLCKFVGQDTLFSKSIQLLTILAKTPLLSESQQVTRLCSIVQASEDADAVRQVFMDRLTALYYEDNVQIVDFLNDCLSDTMNLTHFVLSVGIFKQSHSGFSRVVATLGQLEEPTLAKVLQIVSFLCQQQATSQECLRTLREYDCCKSLIEQDYETPEILKSVLKICGLELLTSIHQNQTLHNAELIDLLVGVDQEPKLIDLLQQLNLEEPQIQLFDLSQTVFNQLSIQEFVQDDAVNVAKLENALLSFEDPMREHVDLIESILENCKESNRLLQISRLRFDSFVGWSDLMRLTVSILENDLQREHFLLLVLDQLLSKMNATQMGPCISEIASQSIVFVVNKFYQEQQLKRLQSPPRLQSYWKPLIERIVNGFSLIQVRGNYNIAFLHLIHHLQPTENKKELYQPLLTVLGFINAKFIETLCQDALSSETVWQTVAFSLLSALTHLYNKRLELFGAADHPLVQFLVQRNYLGSFLNLRQDDTILVQIMNGNYDQVHFKYVFELKLVFLLRLSESKPGAQFLIEYGLLEQLSSAIYLDQNPDPSNSILEPAREAYDDCLVGTLQLVLSLMKQDTKVVKKKLGIFLESHRDMVHLVLKQKTFGLQKLETIELLTGLLSKEHLKPLLQQTLNFKSHLQPENEYEIEKERTLIQCRLIDPSCWCTTQHDSL